MIFKNMRFEINSPIKKEYVPYFQGAHSLKVSVGKEEVNFNYSLALEEWDYSYRGFAVFDEDSSKEYGRITSSLKKRKRVHGIAALGALALSGASIVAAYTKLFGERAHDLVPLFGAVMVLGLSIESMKYILARVDENAFHNSISFGLENYILTKPSLTQLQDSVESVKQADLEGVSSSLNTAVNTLEETVRHAENS
jgi:hypothetical protein